MCDNRLMKNAIQCDVISVTISYHAHSVHPPFLQGEGLNLEGSSRLEVFLLFSLEFLLFYCSFLREADACSYKPGCYLESIPKGI